ncbi:hypothetical protein ASE06_16210 [Sphingopyxis sp. Root214]|nr:hypothetical protein ASD73_13865 [Sphingopyxis sp. Root154]KRC08002.1 hypothetical protein ASE06_16210 [Sphingopyxis sp. Root214]
MNCFHPRALQDARGVDDTIDPGNIWSPGFLIRGPDQIERQKVNLRKSRRQIARRTNDTNDFMFCRQQFRKDIAADKSTRT